MKIKRPFQSSDLNGREKDEELKPPPPNLAHVLTHDIRNGFEDRSREDEDPNGTPIMVEAVATTLLGVVEEVLAKLPVKMEKATTTNLLIEEVVTGDATPSIGEVTSMRFLMAVVEAATTALPSIVMTTTRNGDKD